MLRLFMNNTLFYSFDSSENATSHIITGLTLRKEINTLPVLRITAPDVHPRIPYIKLKRTCMTLAEGPTSLFFGKVSSIKRNYYDRTIEIECEDMLGCLRDEICLLPDHEEGDPTYTYNDLLSTVLSGMGSTDTGEARFGYNSEINIPYATLNIERSDSELSKDASQEKRFCIDYLSILNDTVLNYTGAIAFGSPVLSMSGSSTSTSISVTGFRLNYKTSLRDAIRDNAGNLDIVYIDSAHLSEKDFEYGVNIVSVSNEPSQEEPISVIVPTGNFVISDGTEVEIMMGQVVPSYTHIVRNQNSYNKYGNVAKSIDFGCVAKFHSEDSQNDHQMIAEQNLHTAAVTWSENHIKPFSDKYTITGVDKYYLGMSAYNKPIDICDLVHIDLGDYGVDVIDYCLSLEVDFFNHENDTYIIGPYIPDNILDYHVGTVIEYNDKKRKTKNKRKK